MQPRPTPYGPRSLRGYRGWEPIRFTRVLRAKKAASGQIWAS